jgi:hypothetical protein
MARRRQVRRSPLGAVLLLLVGGILLLNVLGTLEWSIWWSVLKLWPLLLIAAGLDLLLSRSMLGALLSTIVVLVLAVAALWLMSSGAIGGELVTEQIQKPLGESTRASISIEPVVGTLRIGAAAESANLVEGTVSLGEGEEIVQKLAEVAGVATYTLSTEETSWNAFPGGWDQTRVWELGLSPGASLSLEADMAVGNYELDLTGLAVESLHAEMGLGRIKVVLPATGRFDVSVSQGLGAVEIVVPKGMAVRIETDTALAGRRMPDDLVKEEEFYTSPGYADATNRAEIDAAVAMGMLTVRYQE